MSKKKKKYEVLKGFDLASGARYEAGEHVSAEYLTAAETAALLEMGAIK